MTDSKTIWNASIELLWLVGGSACWLEIVGGVGMSKTDAGGVSLLPCPFCGGDAVDRREIDGFPMIYCSGNDCFGPQTTAKSFDDALVQWNTRSTPVRCDGEVDIVQRIKEACAQVADRAVERDEEAATKYPDEAVKFDNRAHRGKTIATAIRALIPDATPPARSDAGSIQPHFYSPDYQAMGDCRVCGHAQDKPWHTPASPPPSGVREALDLKRAAQVCCEWDQPPNTCRCRDLPIDHENRCKSPIGVARAFLAALSQLPVPDEAGSVIDMLERAKMLNSADAMRRAIDGAIALVRGSQVPSAEGKTP